MSEDNIYLSAEDNYSLIDMSSESEMFPHPFTFGNLGMAVEDLRNHWEFLWDFRFTENQVYRDIKDAYDEAMLSKLFRRIILARLDHFDEVKYSIADETTRIVKMRPKSLPKHLFNLEVFEDWASVAIDITDEMLDIVAPRITDTSYSRSLESLGISDSAHELAEHRENVVSECGSANPKEMFDLDDSLDQHWLLVQEMRAQILHRFLSSIGMNSLLTELAIEFEEDRVKVVPYHSFSLHKESFQNKLVNYLSR